MLMLRIDLVGVADERFQVKIEGVDYFIRVYYLPRTRSFYLDLEDQLAVAIQQGVRMVTGYALFAGNKDPRKQWSGDIVALRFLGDGSSTFDLSAITDGTVKLYYMDAETLLEGIPDVSADAVVVS